MSSARPSMPQGAAWSLASRGASQAIQFGATIVLARLIAPEAFGLVGMVAAITAFFALFADAGLGIALVQRKTLEPENVDGAFVISVGVGVTACALLVLFAPAVARFYGHPELVAITRVMAVPVLLGSLGVVPRALLVRNLRLGTLAVVDLLTAVVSSLTSLGLAFAGAGVWALVAAAIATGAAGSGLIFVAARWVPRFSSWRGARPLLGVGLNLLAFNAVNYWARTLDNVLIGAWIGDRELGLYMRAYALMMLPMTEIIGVLGSTMVPALARLQDDHAAARAGYLKSVGVIALATFPAMIGLSLVATPLVALLYGNEWSRVSPMLQILAVVGAIQSVLSTVGWLYTSQGRTDLMFRWGLFATAFTVPLFALGAWLGSGITVAQLYLVANLLLFVPAYMYAGRVVGLRVGAVFKAVLPTAAATGVMALSVLACGVALPVTLHPGSRLAAQVATGVVSYVLACRLVRNRAASDALDFIREMHPSWRRWAEPVAAVLLPGPRNTSSTSQPG